jgi:hypothetical protein
MAVDLLTEKGDMRDLGIHWTDQFLNRFLALRTKFVAGLDKERAKAQDLIIFQHFFELYKSTVERYNIKPWNRFNMDEKGIMLGYISKVRVVCSKYDKKVYMTQLSNQE